MSLSWTTTTALQISQLRHHHARPEHSSSTRWLIPTHTPLLHASNLDTYNPVFSYNGTRMRSFGQSFSFHPLFLLSPSLLQITCDFGYSIFFMLSIILVMTPARRAKQRQPRPARCSRPSWCLLGSRAKMSKLCSPAQKTNL